MEEPAALVPDSFTMESEDSTVSLTSPFLQFLLKRPRGYTFELSRIVTAQASLSLLYDDDHCLPQRVRSHP